MTSSDPHEKPASEADYWLGYDAAKTQLRKLIGKVDEEKKLGVVVAWLHEKEE